MLCEYLWRVVQIMKTTDNRPPYWYSYAVKSCMSSKQNILNPSKYCLSCLSALLLATGPPFIMCQTLLWVRIKKAISRLHFFLLKILPKFWGDICGWLSLFLWFVNPHWYLTESLFYFRSNRRLILTKESKMNTK